jgi:PAS domain S-box-containing protein
LKNSGEFVLYESVRMALELFNLARELKRTRDLYKSVADLAGEIITRHDGDGKWIFVNAEARRVWGLGDRDIKSFHYFDFVHPDDRQATEEIRRRMERDHETVHGFVNRQQTVEGWRLYEWSSAPVLDDSGGFVGFQATGRDITDRDLSG